MTISSNIRKAGPFVGNGTASTFAFSFKVFQASDLEVVRLNVSTTVETILVINSDYTVNLNADQNSNPGGSITLTAGALASGFNLVITSDIQNLQPTDIVNQGGFYPDVIEDALDRATIQIQQLQEAVDRSAKLPITSSADADALVADIVALADDQANIDIVATNIDSVNTAATDIAAIIAAPDAAIDAAASASSASASAASAAASFDSFDDRYLGAKSSPPSVDNDGNALIAGALYFNSTTSVMNVYTGSAWVAAYVSGTDFLTKANNLSDVQSTSTARTNLGVDAGTGNNQYVQRNSTAQIPISSTWTVYESAGVLYFAVSGVAKAKLDSSGDLTCVGNVTAYGTM